MARPAATDRRVLELGVGGVARLVVVQAPRVGQGRRRLAGFTREHADSHVEMNRREAVERLYELLTDGLRLRMRSDVPLGVFFSGGIDSTAVLARARRASGGSLTAFTIDFEEADHSEASHARAIANYLECDHVEATLSSADALAIIPELPSIY